MERKVLIYNQDANTTKTVTVSGVNTLGELKQALSNQGIIIEDNMDVTEGFTKTALISDNSVLPSGHTNPKTGSPTNDLIIALFRKNKKIESGMDRKNIYVLIKKQNLENDIKEKTGKNFTNLPNDILEGILNELMGNSEVEEDKEKEKEHTCKCKPFYNLSEIKEELKDGICAFVYGVSKLHRLIDLIDTLDSESCRETTPETKIKNDLEEISIDEDTLQDILDDLH